MDYKYDVKEEIATISRKGSIAKKLTVTSWNGNSAKYDLRIWRDQDGKQIPGKGITLDDEELASLIGILQEWQSGGATLPR